MRVDGMLQKRQKLRFSSGMRKSRFVGMRKGGSFPFMRKKRENSFEDDHTDVTK